VPEVHQFPDRVVCAGPSQLTVAIPGDLDVMGDPGPPGSADYMVVP
jgi:hypothetical protein